MSIALENYLFRVAGVLVKDQKLLLHKTKNGYGWVLPGGKAEINEETAMTVVREFEEELGLSVRADRLLWIIENFNAYGVPLLHEHGMYYWVEATDVIVQDTAFIGKEELGILYQWVDIDALDQINIYPRALGDLIQELAHLNGMKHVINNDLE